MFCVSKVCICSSNSYFSSTYNRGCSKKQTGYKCVFQCTGHPCDCTSLFFYKLLFNFLWKEGRQEILRQISNENKACSDHMQPHANHTSHTFLSSWLLSPRYLMAGIHIHGHPLGRCNCFPLLTLGFSKMGPYISL